MKSIPESQIPQNEILWVQYHAVEGGEVTHIITSSPYRDTYYLYKVDSKGRLKKTKWQSADPTELMERIRKNGT